MSGSTLRRTVLVLVLVTLLLPLASASAAPAKRSESGFHTIRMTDWSRTLLQSVSELLGFLRPATEADSWPKPPGQMPPSSKNREGNAADPHGRP